jgi:hypothetical protein
MNFFKLFGTLMAIGSIGVLKANGDCVPDTRTKYTVSDHYNYTLEKAFDSSLDSFEAWVKVPANSVGGTIMGNYFNPNQGFPGSTDYYVDALGRVGFFRNAKQLTYTFKNARIDDGEYHHVAIVRDADAGTFTLYIDGELVETLSASISDNICTIPMSIGVDAANWTAAKTPFDGKIRQVTCYTGAISQDKIKSDMETTEIKNDDGNLLGNWVLGDPWLSTEVKETSGSENDAILKTYEKYIDYTPTTDYDYSYIVVPDIQTIGNYQPQRLTNLFKWIVDSKDGLKLQFVLQTGDLSDFGDREDLYQRAAVAMSQMDGIVPYSFVPGNHDYNDNSKSENRNTGYYNTYFPYAKYSKYSYFGGAYEEGKMDNTYDLYEVGDVKYLVINLEFGPRVDVLRWAGRICDKYPDRRVILLTHCYVDADGRICSSERNADATNYGFAKASSATSGTDMRNYLVKQHQNIFAVYSGHITVDDIVYRKDIGVNGNEITSFLLDAQAMQIDQGGIGEDPILIVKVNEAKKESYYEYYSPSKGKYFNIQNQFTLSFADENNPTIGVATIDNSPDVEESGPNNLGIIIGCSIGGVVALGAAGVGTYFVVRKKKVKTK